MDYHSFEEDIHVLVLERGKAYFDQGAVHELTRQDSGWSALVQGQKTYRVMLHGRNILEEWVCDCPDAHGPVCKHVTAVLYAIRDKAVSEAYTNLDELSDSQLRAFVRWQMQESPALRKMLQRYLSRDEEE
jgi:uncharacterized Zn finger protein